MYPYGLRVGGHHSPSTFLSEMGCQSHFFLPWYKIQSGYRMVYYYFGGPSSWFQSSLGDLIGGTGRCLADFERREVVGGGRS